MCLYVLYYRLGSQFVHLYANFTPVILQHRIIAELKYEYALICSVVLFSIQLVFMYQTYIHFLSLSF